MQNADILLLAGLRIDGRKDNELREFKHSIGVSSGGFGGSTQCDGSAYMELGLNKVLVLINGPREAKKRNNEIIDSEKVREIINHTFLVYIILLISSSNFNTFMFCVHIFM